MFNRFHPFFRCKFKMFGESAHENQIHGLTALPELPSATQEEAQLTMQLESALQRLQQAETEEPEQELQEEEGGAP